ncbi:gp53-like domain-containing protein [Xenorhabdus sp. IM139775]|uniref:gp53-like domain-containing protein n=1 Tax=Xenorhabdus sp. IM139775 TaxID=3025876 RepID=UPI003FD1756C
MSNFQFSGNWFKQPNGWIVQVFSLELPADVTSGSVAFPLAFPGSCRGAVVTGGSMVGFSANPGIVTLNIASLDTLAWRRFGSTDSSSVTVLTLGF